MHKHIKLPQAFKKLGLEVRFLKAIAQMGFEEPSDIQRALIPEALRGVDILGQARTGTGKTAAFGLPTLQQLDKNKSLQAICLAPTRELAVQVCGELRRMAEYAELRVVAIYGGEKVATQVRALGRKPHFVAGTPGRVIDFINRGKLNLSGIRHVILDEVDRMLDIGFRDDIREILSRIRSEHQTIFVSATIEDEIKRLAQKYMHDPIEINVSQDKMTVEEVDQYYVTADSRDKWRLLKHILEIENPPCAIVFCNTKAMVRKVAQKLHNMDIQAQGILGDLPQHKRDRVMRKFRANKIQVLVATDLAARGLDVSSVTHIINYDVPPDPEVYVHRIGRTARMGSKGIAITMVQREEGKELTRIEMLINREIPQRNIEGFKSSESPKEQLTDKEFEPGFSRFKEPLHADQSQGDQTTTKNRPRKTLGGRFKPSRRRRL